MKLKKKKKIKERDGMKTVLFQSQGNTKLMKEGKKLTVRLKRVGRWSDGWVIFVEKKEHETN